MNKPDDYEFEAEYQVKKARKRLGRSTPEALAQEGALELIETLAEARIVLGMDGWPVDGLDAEAALASCWSNRLDYASYEEFLIAAARMAVAADLKQRL
jgi:hypothetical protein